MAYDEYLADRIRLCMKAAPALYDEKKMMGGLCFLVDDKMCCGIHFDKKTQQDLLMARIGEEAHDDALAEIGCHPMDFTGRPMKGYVFVDPSGFDGDDDLSKWIKRCLDFNPHAKSSKKKKK